MEIKRIKWIDVAKGFAMLLVILGHIPTQKYLDIIIYAFHMPLFFLMSGYLIKVKDISFREYVIKKFKTLIVPLIIYSGIIIFFNLLFYCMILHNESYQSTMNRIIGIVVQMKSGIYSSCLWFLPCLFVAQLILYPIIRRGEDKHLIVFIVILLVVGDGVYAICNKAGYLGSLPWCLDYVLLAASMLLMGYVIRNVYEKVIFSSNLVVYIYGLMFFVSMTINYKIYGGACMFSKQGDLLLTAIESISGTLFTIGIIRNIKECKILEYIGRNSLFYYSMQFIVFAIPNIIVYNILKINVEDLNNFEIIVFDVLYMVITLVILKLLNEVKIKIINKAEEEYCGDKAN